MFVGAARGARRFFGLFRAFGLNWERARRRRVLPFRKKKSGGFPADLRRCTRRPNVPNAAPVAHSLSCLRFFGRSSHIPRLFFPLVSAPSRLIFFGNFQPLPPFRCLASRVFLLTGRANVHKFCIPSPPFFARYAVDRSGEFPQPLPLSLSCSARYAVDRSRVKFSNPCLLPRLAPRVTPPPEKAS